jgi:dihydrofolate reductase
VGRKTYESIGGPLQGRFMIVLTRRRAYAAPGCVVVHTPQEALDVAGEAAEVVIGGGAAIYALYLPLAERIYLTEVAAEPAGDTFFPELDPEAWREVSRESHPADERHAHAFDFVTLERR